MTAEPGNRTLLVRGLGGRIPNGGTSDRPLGTFCGQRRNRRAVFGGAGLPGPGVYRLQGTDRMQRTAASGLVRGACANWATAWTRRTTGCRRTFLERGRARRHLRGGHGGKFAVRLRPRSCARSAACGSRRCRKRTPEQERYVAMTSKLIESFPRQRRRISSGTGRLQRQLFLRGAIGCCSRPAPSPSPRSQSSDWQIDAAFPNFLPLPADNFAADPAWRQHHDGDGSGAVRRRAGQVHASGAAARAGVRAGGGDARRIDQMRRAAWSSRARAWPIFPAAGKPARSGNRNLQRSSRGDVFCHSGFESRGH